jgi:hypothetical protein
MRERPDPRAFIQAQGPGLDDSCPTAWTADGQNQGAPSLALGLGTAAQQMRRDPFLAGTGSGEVWTTTTRNPLLLFLLFGLFLLRAAKSPWLTTAGATPRQVAKNVKFSIALRAISEFRRSETRNQEKREMETTTTRNPPPT